jgi:hypothetical protein
LFNIGVKIPEIAKLPPDNGNIEKALGAIDVAYHMNHRKGEIGHYGFQMSGPRSATMLCRNPYSCDFDRGIMESMARRFKPTESVLVKVRHDDHASCRKKGADSCTYHVTW